MVKQQNLPYPGHSNLLTNEDDEYLIETVYYIHLKPIVSSDCEI